MAKGGYFVAAQPQLSGHAQASSSDTVAGPGLFRTCAASPPCSACRHVVVRSSGTGHAIVDTGALKVIIET
ncbi:hypothetical protein [Rugamonas sp. DEMB1]|uniref:hypothetical protein n=1 Tax=Rugamonas sp. DEMB1 TaxID=3039386 RepID=UPI002449E288|nr:hypothetical protein [Rugamonas sp. DEMB1]WGG52629.1 hypothetical protein QC826_11075 [Rugamonas sp. DEMB1]